jgi:hypothetical protein
MTAPQQEPGPYDGNPPSPIALLTALVDCGISPNSRNSAGMTVFHTFVRSLSAGPKRILSLPTPPERLDRLLQFFKGSVADLDIDIADNDAPLHHAAMSMSPGSVQCVDTLFSLPALLPPTRLDATLSTFPALRGKRRPCCTCSTAPRTTFSRRGIPWAARQCSTRVRLA